MADSKTKVKTALDESRMLVLGTQVLMGSEFTAVFQSSFAKLPAPSQYLVLGAAGLLLVALTLFMSAAPYHQIAEHGQATPGLNRYITRAIGLALFPFALGLGINLYVVTAKLANPTAGLLVGGAAALVALFFWHGLEALRRSHHEHHVQASRHGHPDSSAAGDKPDGTSIQDRVTHVLTEARVVLPGVQALIGFQFSSMFTDAFDKLPDSSKYLHLGSISLMAIAMILLMTPAAYHRIVEQGESTEHFQRFASRLVLASLVPLAVGISLEFFVIARKISQSEVFAGVGAAVLLLLFLGVWFGFTLWRRAQQGPTPTPP